jgi:iron complex outermembrane receptor protein
MRATLATFLALLAACPAVAHAAPDAPADDADARPFALGEIVVTAPRAASPAVGSDALSADAITTFDRVTLDDAVNLLPGVSSGNSGGSRNERLIFVRGFNRFEVPLSIDGIRVYLPADNRLDFGRFLTSDIAEVQVAKGYVSVLNGPDGMGGAINLVTRKPVKPIEAEVSGTLDLGHDAKYAGYNLSALLGTRRDKWYAQASYTRNYQDHWDLAGGYNPTAIQAAGQRNLSETQDWRVNVKAGFTPNSSDEYSISYTRQEGAKLAPLSVVDPLSAQKFWTWPAWNTDSVYFLSTTALGDQATLKARIYRNTFYNLLRSFDNAAENTQTLGKAFNSPYWDEAYGGSAQLDIRPTTRERLSVSFQYRRDRHQEAQTSFPSGATEPIQTDLEDTYSAGVENEYAFTPAVHLTLGLGYDWRQLIKAEEYGSPLGTPTTTPAVLYDYPMRDTSAWSAQGQLAWTIDADSSLHLSLSSRARFPTIFERFSQRFGTSIPNPYLRPERATHFELGGTHAVRFGPGVLTVDAAAFYSHVTDAIVSEPTIGYSCTASTTPGPCAASVLTQSLNLGHGDFYGVEISLNADLGPHLALGANYTWTHRKLVDPGNAAFRPTDVPTHKAFVYANWTPVPRFHLIPSADIASDRWTVTDVAPITYYRTGAYVNAAVRAEYDLLKTVKASVGVRNLFDANYQLVDGFLEPGRSFFLSLKAAY